MYTTTDETGWKQSNAFKKVGTFLRHIQFSAAYLPKTFSIDVDIEFIGVW